MKKKTKIVCLMSLLVALVTLSVPLWSCSCGFRYMPKPKVVVEGTNPEASFYATVLALDRLGYRVQAVDTEAYTIVTEPRSGGSFWWQFSIAVAANGHVAVDTKSDLEMQRGAQTITHKGVVNRSIQLSKHVRNIIYKTPEDQIIAEGAATLPGILTTAETQLVIPGT